MGVMVDSNLVARALELSGERTKKAVVTKALEEFIAYRRTKKQRELLNSCHWIKTSGAKDRRRR
jgi:hypothetical protein